MLIKKTYCYRKFEFSNAVHRTDYLLFGFILLYREES